MKSWQQAVLNPIFSMRLTLFKWLMALVLVLSLTSCAEKVASQEVPVSHINNPSEISQISKKFSEISPPEVIQELRLSLENHRPQVTIVTPQPDEILQNNTVTVSFEVKDLAIFKDPQLELGPHLHVILDNQPYIAVYDVNKPLILPDLSPGTHTLRAFASRPWHESFKNEGAYAQTTFHIFTKTDDNNPDPTLPVLTYSRPKGNYGAEPILLDFYLTNAPLHLVSEDNPNDTVSDWRIRCTINGESFIFDRWQAVYLKGFKPGKNWVKLEFLDNQGNPLKNAFNTTARLINYQPNGQDTLAKIVRGELKADEVRSIVDPDYIAKKQVTEPTPEPQPQVIPESQVPEIPPTQLKEPEITPTPEVEEPQAPVVAPSPTVPPTLPEMIETPASQGEPAIIPTSEVKEPQAPVSDSPPEEQRPEVTPTDKESTSLPTKIAPDPQEPGLKKYFDPEQLPNIKVSPALPPLLPETTPIPQQNQRAGEYKVTSMEE
ncbi:FHA domain containing protein [Umezakia ovalisporum]|uniref:hypothetical protein n=1 Tax=Umezakia ovalisporum TaxID=75695 RepID=UPI0006EECD2E|nr:FHA domain containing protein [Umezakia ovalisporum]